MAKNVLLPMTVALVVSVFVVVVSGSTASTRPDEEPRPERRAPSVPAPDRGADSGGSIAPPPALADVGERFRALESRLEVVEGRLASVSTDVGRIEEEVTGPDPADLGDDDLRTRASALYSKKDYEGSLRYWLALLERDLTPEQRAEALQSVGFAYRMTKRPAESENYFRRLLAHHGEDTPEGMFALYHVAWCRSNRDDLAGARDLMERVSTTPHTAEIWKIWSRANAADFTIRLGEKGRARTMLESLKADLAGNDSANGLRVRGYVDRMLADLDG